MDDELTPGYKAPTGRSELMPWEINSTLFVETGTYLLTMGYYNKVCRYTEGMLDAMEEGYYGA